MSSFKNRDGENVEAMVDNQDRAEVVIQDQTTQIITAQVFRVVGQFTLAANVVKDTRTFTVVAGHAIQSGHLVCFQYLDNFMQAIVTNVSTNTITIDTLFDYAFVSGQTCNHGTLNMNVDGSTTPVVFQVGPVNLMSGVSWDITQLRFSMTDDVAMDDSKFGGISTLTRGLLIRQHNGVDHNIATVKSNGDFTQYGFDIVYSDKAPAGVYGIRGSRKFSGNENSGVVIRLNSGSDVLQVIVQDNLTALSGLYCTVIGHFVD
jgi:hypothetical protein